MEKRIKDLEAKASHLEEQLKHAHEQLEHAEAEHKDKVRRLAGGIAHNFNNILGGIMGNADLLSYTYGTNNKEIAKFSEAILTSSQRAASLVEKLLAFSGQGMFDVKDLDVHKIIKDVHKDVYSFIEGKDIVITTDLSAGYPIVHGARNQLYSSLLTLGINACEAVGNKGEVSFVTENVSLDQYSKIDHHHDIIPGGYIKISVIDNGKGLDEKVRKKVFEPFLSLNASNKTGLGLASVYGSVNNHKGYIDVISSSTHRGTKFELYLPVPKKAGDR
jgi:nitrogen-specific signal transduction histidine kinase